MKLINTNLINEKKLPNKVNIATISTTCCLNVDINCLDIWKQLPINSDIKTIKFNKEIKSTDKKLLEKERKKREKKEKKMLQKKKNKISKSKRKTGENFYNCIIVVVNVTPTKIINIKLFRNGSIQMTGSKNLNQTELALSIILKYLKMKYKSKINNKTVQIPLLVRKLETWEEEQLIKDFPVENDFRNERYSLKYKMDYRKLKLYNFNINMINTSFALDYKIHLVGLNSVLETRDDCIVTYEPSIHAGINIKINRTSEEEIINFNNKIKKLQIDYFLCRVFILHHQTTEISPKQLEEINKRFLDILDENVHNNCKNYTFKQIHDYVNKTFDTNCISLKDMDTLKSELKPLEKIISKYKMEIEKKATILVFQSNDPKKMCNLIITGVTKEAHIIKAYNYILNLITSIKSQIIKINVEELLEVEMLRLTKEKKALDIVEDVDHLNNLFIR
jgi:TATA-box binding protein (TBP) (component of TFIID and TFIIIB)